MRLISWNVNGLRACLGKGFQEVFDLLHADVFCLQETKLHPDQIALDLPGYTQYWNSAEKKGYSGTAVFSRIPPRSVACGLGIPHHDTEGRVITIELDEFYVVTCYTPNSQRELTRLNYRLEWDDAFREYLVGLDARKPVVVCGDFNVAHQEIDLKHPRTNRGNSGFTDEERDKFTALLAAGFTDTYRYCYPDRIGAYSWWSYLRRARETNAGWRIDYFLVSNRLCPRIQDAAIYREAFGSDHCPVGLDLEDLPV